MESSSSLVTSLPPKNRFVSSAVMSVTNPRLTIPKPVIATMATIELSHFEHVTYTTVPSSSSPITLAPSRSYSALQKGHRETKCTFSSNSIGCFYVFIIVQLEVNVNHFTCNYEHIYCSNKARKLRWSVAGKRTVHLYR